MEKLLILGILSIAGAFLIDLTFGYIYTMANIIPYIMGYIKRFIDSGIPDKYSVWLSALALAIQGFTMPLGGLVERKFGFRIVVILSCIFESGSVLLTYFTIKHSFALILLTYALLGGAGPGFGYSVVIAVSVTWFPKRRGLIVGIVVSGFGLGASLFTPIQTALINPDNVKVDNVTRHFTDEDLLNRLPTAFLTLGGILVGLQVVGMLLLRSNTYEKKEGLKVQPNMEEQSDDINLPPRAMLKCIDFYLLWFIMFCHIIPITIITSVYKLYGQKHISDDRFLTAVATLSSVCNALGRIFWGAVVDHASFKIPMGVMLIVWATILITFPHLHFLGGIGLKVAYTLWVGLLFFSLSGVFAIMPAAVSTVFGPKFLAINYGLIFNSFALGATLCAVIVTLVDTKDSYLVQFSGCAVVCLIALFTLLWVEDRKMPSRFRCLSWFSSRCMGLRSRRIIELTPAVLHDTKEMTSCPSMTHIDPYESGDFSVRVIDK